MVNYIIQPCLQPVVHENRKWIGVFPLTTEHRIVQNSHHGYLLANVEASRFPVTAWCSWILPVRSWTHRSSPLRCLLFPRHTTKGALSTVYEGFLFFTAYLFNFWVTQNCVRDISVLLVIIPRAVDGDMLLALVIKPGEWQWEILNPQNNISVYTRS